MKLLHEVKIAGPFLFERHVTFYLFKLEFSKIAAIYRMFQFLACVKKNLSFSKHSKLKKIKPRKIGSFKSGITFD